MSAIAHTSTRHAVRVLQALAATLAAALLVGCERPPITAIQNGYRGTGMEQVNNPRIDAKTVARNQAPEAAPAAAAEGPKAGDVYKNVKVLGHLSVGEFTRHMTSITQWVAPKEGCAYCHNLENLADDGKYTKVVARRMVQMTQHLNSDWKPHVGETGVTCYTCHRGNAVPSQVWYAPADRKYAQNSVMGDLAGQNIGALSVGYSSLPNDPFTPYLLEDKPIRVNGDKALKFTGDAANRHTTKQAEHTYGLMMHMSNSLGVNCTFCHNTRAFQSWDEAPPQRVTAWQGIRMARDLNVAYLEPLTKTFPANRLGPKGDVAKVNCSTCHQGVNKPLLGAQMAKGHPELLAAYKPTDGLPAPVAEAARSVMYFNVGSAVLEGEQAKGMAQLIANMSATPAIKATISGYHSAAGELVANQELAKQRAFTVRDSLLAAGVPADRVVLEKPMSAEANLAGEDPAARRVEVTVK
jgi:photosynthetic reaction center cytochrome c subunit